MSFEESIHYAAIHGDILQVFKILTRDPSCINDYNDEFKTPLYLLIENFPNNETEQVKNRLKLLELLIDSKADVNLCSCVINYREENYMCSPLEIACKKNQVWVVKYLLQNKADPNVLSTSVWEILLKFFFSKDILKLLFDFKIDFYKISRNYEYDACPLNHVIFCRDIDIVEQFRESGAKSPNIYKTLIHSCQYETSMKQDEQKITKYLLNHVAELDTHGQFSTEALMYHVFSTKHDKFHASKEKCLILEWLSKKDTISGSGDSYLHQAIQEKDVAGVKTLLQMGMDVNKKNYFGDTPLHMLLNKLIDTRSAAEYSSYDNDVDDDLSACSLISYSISEQYRSIGELLINHGADVRSQNFICQTPFQLAAEANEWMLLNLMLAKITNIDTKTLQKNKLLCHIDLNLARICYKDDFKMHELTVAIALGYEQVTNRLLDINNYVDKSNVNCIHRGVALAIAAETRQYRIVKKLLEAGFNSNSSFDSDGRLQNGEYFLYSAVEFRDNYDILYIGCLLWEFKDSSIINNATILVSRYIICPEVINPISMKLVYLLIFFYAINIRTNKLDKELVPMKGLFKLHHKKMLSIILTECNKKLDKLKEIKVGEVIISNIMTMELDSLVKLLNNTTYFDACTVLLSVFQEKKKDLKYYEFTIKTRLELAIEKREVLNSAKKILDKVFEEIILSMHLNSLPDEIKWNILLYLNVYELKKLTKTD